MGNGSFVLVDRGTSQFIAHDLVGELKLQPEETKGKFLGFDLIYGTRD